MSAVLDDGWWRQYASCLGMNPEDFFAQRGVCRGGVGYPKHVVDACRSCPVWEECLRDALSDPDSINYGYWAGTTPRTRHRMRRDPDFRRSYMARERGRRLRP